MRNLTLGALSVMLITAAVQAQAPNRAAIEKTIIANENAINTAFARGDAATFKKMVAPDGWGVDATGIVTLEGYVKQMGQTGKGMFMGQPIPSPTYASTVWVNRGGSWVPVFHQETMAASPMPAKK